MSCNWVKVSGLAWQGNGFYYSRYDAPKQGKELTSSNDDHKVYYHHVGTRSRRTSWSTKTKPTRSASIRCDTTEDERFAILTISDRGKGKKGNALFFRDATKPGQNVDAARR